MIHNYTCLATILTACLLSNGCSSWKFDAEKNKDIKNLAVGGYTDLTPKQIYAENGLDLTPLRSRFTADDDQGDDDPQFGPVYTIQVSPAVGGAIAGAFLIGKAAQMVVIHNRTELLNSSNPVDHLKTYFSGKINQKVSGMGYTIHNIGSLSQTPPGDIKKPYSTGLPVPGLEDIDFKNIIDNQHPQGILIINILQFGVHKLQTPFVADRFQPFVIVGVKYYRSDTKRLIHYTNYLGLSDNYLPITNDYEKAIDDRTLLEKFYIEAIDDAIKIIEKDIKPLSTLK